MSAEPVRHRWRAAVLTYHSLDESGSVLSTSPCLFAEQMQVLAESGVRIVPLMDLPGLMAAAPTDAPVVALTFDDGFRSVVEHALPVLVDHGFPATVFVVGGYCGRTNAWPSQPAHVARHPLLGWADLRALAQAGVSTGCHTRTHPDLRRLTAAELSEEVAGAKAQIEDGLGAPVETFAYPYGMYDRRVRALAADHFSLACATTLGFVASVSDRYAIKRLDMYYLRRLPLLAHLFAPSVRCYLGFRRSLRGIRAHTRRRKLRRIAGRA
jgi:peptidoglycan/xylan/chitin deacetylase (PgdA/CDA1 family)